MGNLLYILLALVIFGVIVCSHELGHYLAARAVGIGVEEFSVGFGPKLFGWKRKGIAYSLRLIPLGGYCRFVGDDETDERPDAINNQSVWKRIVTVFSGPFMNFVLAYVVAFLFLTCAGVWYSVPQVTGLTQGLNAQSAGIEVGDVITSVNGEEIAFNGAGASDLRNAVQAAPADQPLEFGIARGDQTLTISIAPSDTAEGRQIGILMGAMNYRYPVGAAFTESFRWLGEILHLMVDSLKNLFTTGEGIEDTVGPVGLISVMSTEIQRGWETALTLTMIISLNLGLVNLLPIPALDGGRLVILLVEAVRRKPIKPEYEGWIHAAGFLLLIGVVVVVTYRDIVRLVTGG